MCEDYIWNEALEFIPSFSKCALSTGMRWCDHILGTSDKL